MSYYKDMYYRLFNIITDVIESIEVEDIEYAKALLIQAQQDAEDMFIEAEGEEEDTATLDEAWAAKELGRSRKWIDEHILGA